MISNPPLVYHILFWCTGI